MNLNQLQHFIAVAELLHFGAAARRLGIAQPQLSQSIKRLEDELGVLLLERSRNHVALTHAGQAFLDESRQSVQHAEKAVRVARLAGNPDTRDLRVGCMTISLYTILPRALERFHAAYPQVTVSLEEITTPFQLARLQDRTLELGMVGLNLFEPPENAVAKKLMTSPYVAAIPASWPEAQADRLRLADFAERPFILFPPHQAPSNHAALLEACRAAGYSPRIVEQVTRTHTALTLVARGVGMTFVAEAARANLPEDVVLRTVDDLPAQMSTEVYLVWIPPVMSKAHRALIEHILEAARALYPAAAAA